MSQPDPHAYLLRAIDPYQLAIDCGIGKPAPWQMNALRSTRDRIALRVCRQAGKTTTAALLGLHNALYQAGSTTLIFAPKEAQSIELFAKILAFWRRIEPGARPTRQNMTELIFPSGSRVIALPAEPDTVRGYTGSLLIVDEAAHLERDEELIAAILPMLARTKGRLIALSTPAGKRGWFYRICSDPRWEQFVITWRDVDYLTEDQLDEARAALGPLFAQEYEVAFIDSGATVFPSELVAAAFDETVPVLFSEAPAELAAIDAGRERDWVSAEFYVGIDLGQKLDSAVIAIGERVAPMGEPTQFRLRWLESLPLGTRYTVAVARAAAVVNRLHRRPARVTVDRSGVGQAPFEEMQERGLNPVGIVFRGGTGSSGTGAERTVSKVELVTALQRALHEGRLRIAKDLPEAAALLREFADFELTFSPSGSVQWGAASGRHDDRIAAICCALWGAIDGSRSAGWLDHFARLARMAKGEDVPAVKVPPPLTFGIPVAKPAAMARLRTPRPHMNFYVRSRRRYASGPDCVIADVHPGDDVDDLKASGCVVIEDQAPARAASQSEPQR